MTYFTYKMYNDDVMYNGNNYSDGNDGWTRIMLVQKNAIIYIVKKKKKNHKKKNTTQNYLILQLMMIIEQV